MKITPQRGRPRITPAWAGKSWRTQRDDGGGKDHPRVGGEKRFQRRYTPRQHGSPPRGRGKGSAAGAVVAHRRITPAWAGKRRRLNSSVSSTWDHPRVGGEKLAGMATGLPEEGSPPRGRGKVPYAAAEPMRARITPAWAGKRNAGGTDRGTGRDHPRVGGEKTKKIP